jgi:hypothetical protein
VATSGLSSPIAVKTATQLACEGGGALCPGRTAHPEAASLSSRATSASLPVTRAPRAAQMRASPEVPIPPMPTKCWLERSGDGAAAPVGSFTVLDSVTFAPRECY